MTSSITTTVACPQCGRLVKWVPQNRYRPFCSERCKLVDLGEWATERYRIPDEADQERAEPGEAPPG